MFHVCVRLLPTHTKISKLNSCALWFRFGNSALIILNILPSQFITAFKDLQSLPHKLHNQKVFVIYWKEDDCSDEHIGTRRNNNSNNSVALNNKGLIDIGTICLMLHLAGQMDWRSHLFPRWGRRASQQFPDIPAIEE